AKIETLREGRLPGTTSRAVAGRGSFNPALIFYYFGSMDGVLLAALDWTSEQRLAAYREALAKAASIEEVVAETGRLYREDRDSGHITVISQMIAGSIGRPELVPELIVRMQPWIDLIEQVLQRLLSGSQLTAAIPSAQLAYAVATFYLGANLLTHLDPDRERTDALFARLDEVQPLLAGPLGRGQTRDVGAHWDGIASHSHGRARLD